MTALDFLVNACLNKEQQCSFSVSLFDSSYKWKEKNPTTHSQRKISNILLGIIFFSLYSGQRGQRDQSQLRIVNSISKYSYLEILTSYLEQQVSFTSSWKRKKSRQKSAYRVWYYGRWCCGIWVTFYMLKWPLIHFSVCWTKNNKNDSCSRLWKKRN